MKRLGFLCFFILLASMSVAQEDSVLVPKSFVPQYQKGMTYNVKTISGGNFTGMVTAEDADFVTLEDKKTHQVNDVRKSEIYTFRRLTDKHVAQHIFGENVHAGYYLLSSPSIIYDEKPFISMSSQWFLFENISVSINENWDFTTNCIFVYPTSIGIKCTYAIGNDTYVGGNVFAVGNANERFLSEYFLGYGTLARITKGTSNNNFSISGGVIGINNQLIDPKAKEYFYNVPFANFAWLNRFAERWGFVIDAYYFPQAQSGFGGAGFKFMKNKQTAWTFGCFGLISVASSGGQISLGNKAVPVPFISYSTNILK